MNKKAAHTSVPSQVMKKQLQLGGEKFTHHSILLLAADTNPLPAGTHLYNRKVSAY